MDILKGKYLVNKIRKNVPVEVILKNKNIVVYYFSAFWCKAPQCEEILNILKEVYKESIRRNIGIEVIYVSADTEPEGFELFFKTHGNWFAIHYDDDLAELLRTNYGVTNIPNLIVVKKNGEIITRLGREELLKKGLNVLVTWTD